MEKKVSIIAIAQKDFIDYGCPHCGGIFGYYPVSSGGASVWVCSECNISTVVLSEGMTTSPISVGGVTPKIVKHPREGEKIDREALEKRRAESWKKKELSDYKTLLGYGFGAPVNPKIVSHHTSKSITLPIVAEENANSNVKVVWFGQNFYSHYLGLKFDKSICASFLYPISAVLGEPACSSHVNTEVAKPLPHFIKASYTQEMINSLGTECSGLSAAMIIRFLHEVSKLETKKILDICFEPKYYGKKTVIDNNIDEKALVKAAGLEAVKEGCDYKILLSEDSIFEEVLFDSYDTALGNCSIVVKLKKNKLLPSMTFPYERIFANPSDTILARYLPEDVQQKELPGTYEDYLLPRIPIYLLKYQEDRKNSFRPLKKDLHRAHYVLNADFKALIFNVPNPLDAVMTLLFFVKVVDPIAQVYFKD